MGKKLFGFDVDYAFDYENGFYLTSHVTRLGKMLAHYEIYKRILNIPGHIVECGVFKGTSLIRMATFREIMESPYSRKIIGFDAFGKFPEQQDQEDAKFIRQFERAAGDGMSEDELRSVFAHKAFENYELVEGDILETVPSYAEDHPELRIALLHIDVDVYEPTLAILNHLYAKVVRGGIIVLDDYATVAGETRAVEEFFDGKDLDLRKLPITHIPTFFIKN